MPTPLPKPRRDGSIAYRVRFVLDGRSCSETFETQLRAQWFCDQIEQHGVRFALRALDDLLDARGEKTVDEGPTLDDVIADFWAYKESKIEDSTLDSYMVHYDAHIKPTFGSRHLGLISSTDIELWVEEMASGRIKNTRTGKELSPKTIRERVSLLNQILSWATAPAQSYISVNPCAAKIAMPKRIKPSPKGLLPAQWQALYSSLVELGSQDAADLASFLVGSGWRIGEAMALQVSGVEDYGPSHPMHVNMRRVVRRVGGEMVEVDNEGKSQGAMRRIKLDSVTAEVVRRNCAGKKHHELVFTKNGQPWRHHSFRDKLEKACAHAELPRVTAHWLRHTHVAWLAMSGAPLPELQRRIGHASITTTIGVYGSMIGDVKTDVLDGFAAMRDMSMPPALDTSVVHGEIVEDAIGQIAS